MDKKQTDDQERTKQKAEWKVEEFEISKDIDSQFEIRESLKTILVELTKIQKIASGMGVVFTDEISHWADKAEDQVIDYLKDCRDAVTEWEAELEKNGKEKSQQEKKQ